MEVFIYRNKNHKGCIGIISNVVSIEKSDCKNFTHIKTKSGLVTIETDYVRKE